MKVIQMPDGTLAEFPDNMSEAQIARAIRRETQPRGERVAHLGGRAVTRGVAGTADLVDRGASMLPGTTLIQAARGFLPHVDLRTLADYALTNAGVAEPDTPRERIASDVVEGLTGTAMTLGTGAATRAPQLTQNAVAQVAGAVGGSAAGSYARERGASPLQQAAASFAGGLAPATAATGAAATLRGVVRGGAQGRERMQGNIADFQTAGTEASLGQATQRRLWQAVESFMAKVPGGAGRMQARAEQQGTEMGARLEQLADDISPRHGDIEAGDTIYQGIRGPGGYEQRKSSVVGLLYDRLEQHIDPQERVQIVNTLKTLGENVEPRWASGAPRVAARQRDDYLAGIHGDLLQDSQQRSLLPGSGLREPNQLPYGALKGTRTGVGEELGRARYDDPARAKKLGDVYGAMTGDMRAAVEGKGPEAEHAWNFANDTYRRGAQRSELLKPIIKAGGDDGAMPAKIFDAATDTTDKGATRLTALMKSLKQDERRVIAASVIQKLGRVPAGQQNVAGDTFSSHAFLTQWNRLPRAHRAALFDDLDAGTRQTILAITRVADNVKQGSKVWQNSSGSSAGNAQLAAGLGIGGAAAQGRAANVIRLLGSLAGAGAGARLLTSPTFVKTMAAPTRVPMGAGIPIGIVAPQFLPVGDGVDQ